MTQDELKKGKYVEIEGEAASQDELQEAIKRTQKDNIRIWIWMSFYINFCI